MENSMYSAFDRVYRYQNSDQVKKSPGEKLNEDRETLIQRMRSDGYTDEEIRVVTYISPEDLQMAAKTVVDVAIKKGVTKTESPSFYHVAGQPGCGKSAAIKAIESSLEGIPFASEMDVYRTKHPRITQIKEIIARKYPDDIEKQGKEFVAFTSFFADVLELTVISYMISQGYSVIKETTGKNSKGICGMIDALKRQYPNMSASIACMAVAQEVSIDGTISRGETMNRLTRIFVDDLKKAGVETKPVGRGNVPRSFSEDTCRKIPESMSKIADSGLIDGEFLIVRRGKEDSIVARISGFECKQSKEYIMETLKDRITGEKAKEEEKAHFDKKNANNKLATDSLDKGIIEPTIELYLYPTQTWLKETDGALAFYSKESGLVGLEQVARWVVEHKMIPQLLGTAQLDTGLSDSSKFDEEKNKSNEALSEAGKKLGDVVISVANIKNQEEISTANTR